MDVLALPGLPIVVLLVLLVIGLGTRNRWYSLSRGRTVETSTLPATPQPPEEKRLGPIAWLQMIVLGTLITFVATSLSGYLPSSGPDDPRLYSYIVTSFVVGVATAGRIVGWRGRARWIGAGCLIVVVWFTVAIAYVLILVGTQPPG